MKNKYLKITLWVVGSLLAIVLGYLLYVLLSYSRIPDKQVLTPVGAGKEESLQTMKYYRVATQNIGFGAYSPEFTFFMDGGTESRAASAESVIANTEAAADCLDNYIDHLDFMLIQEVDTDSTRSHHVNQKTILEQYFSEMQSVFASNYHSAYLMYPLPEPHGASNSGLLTLSNYKITSALRRSLPISKGLSKFLDLDRCYTVSRIPVENGKELVLYNVHLSAYGGSDEIRTAQMTMLFEDMKAEYDKGNYCVAGGDFNYDFTGDSSQRLNGADAEFGWAQPLPADLLPEGISRCTKYNTFEPTCRNCDVPYQEGNFTIIVDGFLVSDNVGVNQVQNVQTNFSYSDHNPVYLEFWLKK
jgi:endonuclease/exonuclease/phosphatase family metal-dependent hydrolase